MSIVYLDDVVGQATCTLKPSEREGEARGRGRRHFLGGAPGEPASRESYLPDTNGRLDQPNGVGGEWSGEIVSPSVEP